MKFPFCHSRIFCFSCLILIVCSVVLASGATETKEIEIINYFPPKDVAQSTAKKIVERFEKYRGEECEITFRGPDSRVAAASLQLLGWPAALVILDAAEKFPLYSTVGAITFAGLRSLDAGGFSIRLPDDIKKLRKRFETPPEFPTEAELAKIESCNKLGKLALEAGLIATTDAQCVVTWYLSYIDQLLDKERMPYDLDDITEIMTCISTIGNVGSSLGQIPPQAVPILLKLALNPQRAVRRRLPKACEDELRYYAIMTLERIYRKTLTGVVNIAIIENKEKMLTANYIEMATRTAAELDTTLVEELLAADSKAERDEIAEALGKSGNRAYRRLLWPLLEDSDKKVRYAAARGLAYLGDESGLELIKKQLNDDIDWSTRNTVIEALGRLGNEVACELLCEQLTTYEDYNIVQTSMNIIPALVINAMYETGESFFVEKLFMIRTDEGQLHENALVAIQAVADERAVPILAKRLDDKDAKAAELAADLMIKLMKIQKQENEEPVRAAKRWWSKHGTNPSNN